MIEFSKSEKISLGDATYYQLQVKLFFWFYLAILNVESFLSPMLVNKELDF